MTQRPSYLHTLASRAVASPAWRWLPGMRWVAYRQAPLEPVVNRIGDLKLTLYPGALPDLTDPATLGCVLALVREAHGPSTVVRLMGVNGRGGQEWAVCDRAPAVDGWHMAAPALGYWESEVEALVAALENGGGGA